MAQDAIINRWDINGDVYDIQDAGRGRPLGVATLDENGRVPYTQLPESAIEFKGYWDASTNTPHLQDGTGTKGDLYYVDVAGTQDLGSGSQAFDIGDRVLYDGSVWKNMKSGGTDIEVYPTMADLQQDLPNLEDGTIVATEEGDNFTTVDAVQSGVYNPVTSNAVAQTLQGFVTNPDLAQTLQGYVTNTALADTLKGYGDSTSYISQQALAGFNSYFATVNNYSSFDYATSSGVEYRAIGFKHTNYGTAIAFTRGYILGLYISNNQVTKQRIILNMN